MPHLEEVAEEINSGRLSAMVFTWQGMLLIEHVNLQTWLISGRLRRTGEAVSLPGRPDVEVIIRKKTLPQP
ncbi:MAG TPA: hypothetical protein ENJ72_00175 [Thermodesulfatator sp.]|nr:hypothetical protein [Thermodesulfatator sp.]